MIIGGCFGNYNLQIVVVEVLLAAVLVDFCYKYSLGDSATIHQADKQAIVISMLCHIYHGCYSQTYGSVGAAYEYFCPLPNRLHLEHFKNT